MYRERKFSQFSPFFFLLMLGLSQRFEEVPGKPHWWDGVLKMDSVQNAMDELLNAELDPYAPVHFSLTTLWPSESGSLRGWMIIETETPGRYDLL